MCVCIYVCMYICVYVFVFVYRCVFVCDVGICVYVCICVCVCVCVCVMWVYVFVCVCVYVYATWRKTTLSSKPRGLCSSLACTPGWKWQDMSRGDLREPCVTQEASQDSCGNRALVSPLGD